MKPDQFVWTVLEGTVSMNCFSVSELNKAYSWKLMFTGFHVLLDFGFLKDVCAL